MAEQPQSIKDNLLSDIERAWGTLNASLDKLEQSQITGVRDAQGWSVKDHLIHMAFWERGVCFYLQGKPRHQGMEIDEELLNKGSFDEINAVIQQAQKDMSLPEVQALIHYCHRQLLYQIKFMSDEDLLKRYNQSAADDERTVCDVIYANTAGHFTEHREWILALVEERG